MAQFFASATFIFFLSLFYTYILYTYWTYFQIILLGKRAKIHYSNSSLYLRDRDEKLYEMCEE